MAPLREGFRGTRTYRPPSITVYGDVRAVTGTLGDPFSGDTSFDLDGDVIETGLNSVDQCPTQDRVICTWR